MSDKYEFKVGDKGKTHGCQDYEVTAVGRDYIFAVVGDNEHAFMKSAPTLNRPVERIQGWLNIYHDGFAFMHEDRETANVCSHAEHGIARSACIPIDVEIGEGIATQKE